MSHLMSSRFKWAAEVINPAPDQSTLEIGCGAGLFAELICNRLSTGRFLAIDRSAAMVRQAAKRNATFIEAGIAEFICTELSQLKLSDQHFDIITAFNVNVFWKGTEPEWKRIAELMDTTGRLFIFYQSPKENDAALISRIKYCLNENGFIDTKTTVNQLISPAVACIEARKRDQH